MSTFDGSGIDKVLQAAVDNRAVPHVVAIAADADGVFYEGAAGERVTGGGEQVSTGTCHHGSCWPMSRSAPDSSRAARRHSIS